MKKKIQIALIGAGTMGSMHARIVANSVNAKLSYVIDAFPETGIKLAEKYGASYLSTLSELPEIDGIIIAATTEAHFDLANEVIDRKIPLLIEKPVSDSLERTLHILNRARIEKVPLMCGLLERFNPAVITAKALIEEPVFISTTRHSPYASRIKTGVSWDLLVHDVDLISSFFNERPTKVSSTRSVLHPNSLPCAEDLVEAVLDFGNGRVAHASASRLSQRKIRSMSIQELDRLVEIDLLRRDVTVYKHVSDTAADAEGRGYKQQTIIEIPELLTGVEPLAAQFQHFVELIRGEIDPIKEIESIIPSHFIVNEVISGK